MSKSRLGQVTGLTNFLVLAVFVVLAAVGFQVFASTAEGSVLTGLKLGKQVLKGVAGVAVALGVYFVAKELT